MKTTFTTQLLKDDKLNATGIVVPQDAVEALGKSKKPPVVVTIGDFSYRSTVAVMGGQFLISLSAAHRKASGLAAGDDVTVTLEVADAPRQVEVPSDFGAAMATAGVRPFFDGLSNSLQRMHIDLVNGAKSPETRERRMEKAVGLFVAGKPR